MFNVLDLCKLILILVAGCVYFLGLGWVIIGPLLYGRLVVNERVHPVFNEIPLIFLSGLILNFTIALLIRTLTLGLLINSIIALGGFILFILPFITKHQKVEFPEMNGYKWTWIFFFLVITLPPILAVPTANGDARTMWFFYAKMIFYAGEISPTAGWAHPSVAISHVDYPVFVPMLAAQIMHLFGYWNEYLPKISICFMYLPAIFWLSAQIRNKFSSAFLLLLIPLSFYPWIWEGTMDGLLSTYVALSMLAFGNYLRSKNKLDLLAAACCLFAVLSIKNEGILAFILGSVVILVFLYFMHQKKNLLKRMSWKYLAGIFLGILPLILWTIDKRIWGIENDLQIGTIESIKRFVVRMINGSIFQILQAFLKMIAPALIMLGVIYLFARVNKIKTKSWSYPTLVFILIYSLGMITIYLITPHDLTWHIEHSIFRTTLPIIGLLAITCFFQLRDIEDTLEVKKQSENTIQVK